MVYEYTRPRQPVAAMYNSPGPCYPLPTLVGQKGHDPRSDHDKAPAWQFGVKHGKFYEDVSPGPVHYPDVHYTRQGKDGTPHYSLYGRPQDLKPFKTPGPGTYSPEKAGPSAQPLASSFSFGNRTKHQSTDKNPAPNTYSLPTLLGPKTVQSTFRQAASFSQRGRRNQGGFDEDLQRTPGPGTYTTIDPNRYKYKGPMYSMTSRNEMPGDSTTKPGPGAHSPEKVSKTKKEAPKFSFGIRHSQYITPLITEVSD